MAHPALRYWEALSEALAAHQPLGSPFPRTNGNIVALLFSFNPIFSLNWSRGRVCLACSKPWVPSPELEENLISVVSNIHKTKASTGHSNLPVLWVLVPFPPVRIAALAELGAFPSVHVCLSLVCTTKCIWSLSSRPAWSLQQISGQPELQSYTERLYFRRRKMNEEREEEIELYLTLGRTMFIHRVGDLVIHVWDGQNVSKGRWEVASYGEEVTSLVRKRSWKYRPSAVS